MSRLLCHTQQSPLSTQPVLFSCPLLTGRTPSQCLAHTIAMFSAAAQHFSATPLRATQSPEVSSAERPRTTLLPQLPVASPTFGSRLNLRRQREHLRRQRERLQPRTKRRNPQKSTPISEKSTDTHWPCFAVFSEIGVIPGFLRRLQALGMPPQFRATQIPGPTNRLKQLETDYKWRPRARLWDFGWREAASGLKPLRRCAPACIKRAS